jgi:hypothetical protein
MGLSVKNGEAVVTKIEIQKVNKFKSGWLAEALFLDFSIRIVFKEQASFIAKINFACKLRQRLFRDVGNMRDNWILHEDEQCELYLKSSGLILMWRLQEFTEFLDAIDFIEKHDAINPHDAVIC